MVAAGRPVLLLAGTWRFVIEAATTDNKRADVKFPAPGELECETAVAGKQDRASLQTAKAVTASQKVMVAGTKPKLAMFAVEEP